VTADPANEAHRGGVTSGPRSNFRVSWSGNQLVF